ncbi:unnamed protein product [Fraxinus pennsylvanica]|uniref:Leucine-rich repeat-containing N-terminal plant-type domain-containing protein n=1 Tax=Fraxinus pennsylvanica TaxID=56036 RepID=A0AAD1ZR44_9LAMI|nr:unnamed protein product [Fraxinus pennsylvanica]
MLPPLALCINQEGMYLQKVKLSFDDPVNVLSNWNPLDVVPCNWYGVTCSLDLSSSNLCGPFPYILYRLKNVTFVSLYDNFINSTLFDMDIALCQSLEHLDLA